MDAGFQWIVRCRGVPGLQHLPTFVGLQHRQRIDARSGSDEHRPQQVLPMPRHALDGLGFEQIGGIGQRSMQTPALLVGIQTQIELGRAAFPVERSETQAGHIIQRADIGYLRLMVVHHLEQRTVAQAALDLEGLDQTLERQLLMSLGTEHAVFQRSQQRCDRGLAFHHRAQNLGIDEQADQSLHFGAVTVGDRHADPQVRLPAITLQKNVEPAKQQHEQRQPLAAGTGTQRLHQRRIDFEFVARSTVAGLCRTRMIGGQLQKRVLIAKPLAPVGKLPFLLPRFHPAALPQRIVGILDREGWKSGFAVIHASLVETTELLDQHVHRPTVGHDMMQGQQQYMLLLAQTDQAHAQKRPLAQVERPQRFGLGSFAQAGFPLGLRQEG